MEQKLSRDKIIYGLIALFLLTLLAAATLWDRSDRLERSQVQIVALGDSIFGLTQDETSIPTQVGKLTGMTVFNGAFGGTCISRLDAEHRLDYAKDSLSLVGLAKAVAGNDFGVQQSMKHRESSSEYFEETVDGLEKIDFSAVELVLIMHGLNDYYAGVPIRNEKDSYDEYTFTGALRSAIEFLRQANPEMRVVLVTPTYTWHLTLGQTCEEYNGGGGVQEDYINAEMELAKELGIEVIDIYHDVYPHEKWEDWELYTMDGMHPNQSGRDLLSGIIAEYLGV